ncbi:hypothetical protein EIP91_003559 [Steccherinum ochraceum]|uniref:Protein kinase domain-containing protein n=1 Tax=Steccherinum ochraceum TaxID=92696 RepID=A0A4R0RGP6_9APHY|nr:hypothetical protein EIP91_003559 [Steccherinum ochraceum]
MANALNTPHGLSRFIQTALKNLDSTAEPLAFNSIGDAQLVLNEVWRVLDAPALLDAATGGSQFKKYRNDMRRLSLKVSAMHNILPTSLILSGVKLIDRDAKGGGGFADVFCGTYQLHNGATIKVAIKRIKTYLLPSETEKQDIRKEFNKESILWKNLIHEHIVPFLGVTEEVFHRMFCMVIPWMDHGSLRRYAKSMMEGGQHSDRELAIMVNNWLYQSALGLEYLHSEGIVHGDLHGENILIDELGQACLTDFGLSNVAESSAYMSMSTSIAGGAVRWRAPELIDAQEVGLGSRHPAPESDIFSLACTTVELYSGKPPMAEVNEWQVSLRYMSGKRSQRPSLPQGTLMADDLWALTESCWAHIAADRPSIAVVVASLKSVVGQASTAEHLTEQMAHLGFESSVVDDAAGDGTTDVLSGIEKFLQNRNVTRLDIYNNHLVKDLGDAAKKLCQELPEEAKQKMFAEGDSIGGTILPLMHQMMQLLDLITEDKYVDAPLEDAGAFGLLGYCAFLIHTLFTRESLGSNVEDGTLERRLFFHLENELDQMVLVMNTESTGCKWGRPWVKVHDGYRCGCREEHTASEEEFTRFRAMIKREDSAWRFRDSLVQQLFYAGICRQLMDGLRAVGDLETSDFDEQSRILRSHPMRRLMLVSVLMARQSREFHASFDATKNEAEELNHRDLVTEFDEQFSAFVIQCLVWLAMLEEVDPALSQSS